jgi:glycosyltransferase involved in cell wall biosynthesis
MNSLVASVARWHSAAVATALADFGEVTLASQSFVLPHWVERVAPWPRVASHCVPAGVHVRPGWRQLALYLAADRREPSWARRLYKLSSRFSSHVESLVRSGSYDHLHSMTLLSPSAVASFGGTLVADFGAPAYQVRERILRDIYGASFDPEVHLPEHFIRDWFEVTLRRANLVLAPSRAVADSLLELEPEARVAVVPYAVSEAPPVEPPTPDGALRIGFAGQTGRLKGFDVLVAAAERVPDREIHVAGYHGPDDLDVSGVRHHGQVAPNAMRDFYGRMDLVVQPSRLEGSSLVVYECVMLGVPVIASDACGVPDEVAEGVVIFPSGDVDGLTAAIEALRDGDERERLRRAQLRVRREIGQDAYRARLTRALEDVI